MDQTMTRGTTGRPATSRRPWAPALLALMLYVLAVGVVRFFDWSMQAVQLQQIRQEGQLVPVACRECAGLGSSGLAWMSDGRALLVFAVLLVVAAVGGLVGRTSGRGRRTGRRGLAT